MEHVAEGTVVLRAGWVLYILVGAKGLEGGWGQSSQVNFSMQVFSGFHTWKRTQGVRWAELVS